MKHYFLKYVQVEHVAKIVANSVLMDYMDKSVGTNAHRIVTTPAIKCLELAQALVKVTTHLLSYLIFINKHFLFKYLILYKFIH